MVWLMSSNRYGSEADMSTSMMASPAKDSTGQAAQVFSFAQNREGGSSATSLPLTDNLDHLQVLEKEALLLLGIGLLKRSGDEWPNNNDHKQALQYVEVAPERVTLEGLTEVLQLVSEENRARERAALQAGCSLTFPPFCQELNLDQFERHVLLLLLMLTTNRRFSEMFYLCGFENEGKRNEGMKIGSVISILCKDFREQLAARRYFSINGILMKEEVLVIQGYMDTTTNILDETVCLHERYVRYLVGDNNLYNSAFRYIRAERGTVHLDQVVLPTDIKDEVVAQVEQFLANQLEGNCELDEFFGYGTGLTLLFHGPSGTGKTMFAQSLANHLGRELYSLCLGEMDDMPGSYEFILSTIFREASLHKAIVFFDECDDLFGGDSQINRPLLIELEKARCIVIMATNQPIDLDPAMERRIALKVHFPLPLYPERQRLWHALLPSQIMLAPDVDLNEMAERYRFSGGLIKNVVLIALRTAARRRGGGAIVLTQKDLQHAADLQATRLVDDGTLCSVYQTNTTIESLPLTERQREVIAGAGEAYRLLEKQGTGLRVLINCTDVGTGIKAASALAHECRMAVREFDYEIATSRLEEHKVIDPITHKKVLPLSFAFAETNGDSAILLVVDHHGTVGKVFEKDKNGYKDYMAMELLGKLRTYRGLFCLVTNSPKLNEYPAVFDVCLHLDHPSDEVQLQRWQEHFGSFVPKSELMDIVHGWPMHLGQIDEVCRHAVIQAALNNRARQPSLAEIQYVLSRREAKRQVPILFGGCDAGR